MNVGLHILTVWGWGRSQRITHTRVTQPVELCEHVVGCGLTATIGALYPETACRRDNQVQPSWAQPCTLQWADMGDSPSGSRLGDPGADMSLC